MTVPAGPHLKAHELATLCYKAGWIDAQRLLEAVSIIIAESNGYVLRRGPVHADGTVGNTDGSIDRGLWAINDKAHPDLSDVACDTPVIATRFARKLYLDSGWRSWASFANGQYKDAHAMGYAFDGVANFLRLKNGYPSR